MQPRLPTFRSFDSGHPAADLRSRSSLVRLQFDVLPDVPALIRTPSADDPAYHADMITRPAKCNEERIIRDQVSPWLASVGVSATFEPELWDMTRPDFITPRHVVEVKPCRDWQRGLGQLMLYASFTGLEPVLMLYSAKLQEDARQIYRATISATYAHATVLVWDAAEARPAGAPGWPEWLAGMQDGPASHRRVAKPPKSK